MLDDAFQLRELDPESAPNEEVAALHALQLLNLAETRPDDPLPTLADFKSQLRQTWSGQEARRWAVWRDKEAVAFCEMYFSTTGQNAHVANFWIGVRPPFRRRGIASELLRGVVDVARTEERRILTSSSSSLVDSGRLFMEGLGATMALEYTMSELPLGEVDRATIEIYGRRAAALSADFELVFWDRSWPENEIDSICRMYELMNTAPHDDLEQEDETVTPAIVRDHESFQANQGVERRNMHERRRSDGAIAGYTEVFWKPSVPEVMNQGDTAVSPDFRNRGIGGWLKAAMLEKVLVERPQVARISTGNASSNTGMLHINFRLGFRPVRSSSTWQVPLDKVEAYLETRR